MILCVLRGAEAPLFHSTASISGFFRSLRSRALSVPGSSLQQIEKVLASYPLICPRIARASAAGSAASVIGRPTTMWLAPDATASAGVTTRT